MQWKSKLNACLHDQHVFVLGLKRDLRPSFPTLALDFLPTADPVTTEMVCLTTPTHPSRTLLTHSLQGRRGAEAIWASGYGECSALTNDNLRGAWEGIVNHVVGCLEEHERTIRGERRLGRARSAVAGFLHRLGRFGRARR